MGIKTDPYTNRGQDFKSVFRHLVYIYMYVKQLNIPQLCTALSSLHKDGVQCSQLL